MKGTIETLRAARNNLLTQGWIQGSYGDFFVVGKTTGPSCAKGHLLRAELNVRFPALKVLADTAKEVLAERGITTLSNAAGDWCPVVLYNDHVATDITDIVKLFDRAIAKAEGIQLATETENYLASKAAQKDIFDKLSVQDLSMAKS